MHYNIYYVDEEFPKNTFNYSIGIVDEYLQLTITNGEGDWAIYNSVFLSTPRFNTTAFSIYPNPIKETLHINNTTSQSVTATIYDLNGKQLQSHSLENNLSTLNVKALNQGLYFVVFESEDGDRVSKKFVKL